MALWFYCVTLVTTELTLRGTVMILKSAKLRSRTCIIPVICCYPVTRTELSKTRKEDYIVYLALQSSTRIPVRDKCNPTHINSFNKSVTLKFAKFKNVVLYLVTVYKQLRSVTYRTCWIYGT